MVINKLLDEKLPELDEIPVGQYHMFAACRGGQHARIIGGEPLSQFTGGLINLLRGTKVTKLPYPACASQWEDCGKYRYD
jgi:hypothetical protein